MKMNVYQTEKNRIESEFERAAVALHDIYGGLGTQLRDTLDDWFDEKIAELDAQYEDLDE